LEDRKISKSIFDSMFNNFGYVREVGDRMVVRELVLIKTAFLRKRGYG